MFCRNCGAKNREGAAYCASCGLAINAIHTQQNDAQSQNHFHEESGANVPRYEGPPFDPSLHNNMDSRKKSKAIWLWILIPVILLLLVFVAVYFFVIAPYQASERELASRSLAQLEASQSLEAEAATTTAETLATTTASETTAVTSEATTTAETTTSAPTETTTLPPTETTAAAETSTTAVETLSPQAIAVAPPVFTDYEASSTLRDTDFGTYSAHYAFDGNVNTSWVEGATDDGIGQWIEMRANEKQTVNGIRIMGGYNKTQWLFDTNHRPSLLVVQFDDGTRYELAMRDGFRVWNEFTIPTISTSSIRITIMSTIWGDDMYDTCISEIEVY